MKKNIVIFSSGESERNGTLDRLTESLSESYNCYCWRDLFTYANHTDQIALLPTLLKKIPTFDFAILICEGHDEVRMHRNGHIEEAFAMRDNVLFETGLAIMGLGLLKTIIVADENVRLPDDLMGVNGNVAVHIVPLDMDNVPGMTKHIKEWIEQQEEIYAPVVVGASVSTAEGYLSNFILRLLVGWNDSVIDCETGEEFIVPLDKVKLYIYLSEDYYKNGVLQMNDKVGNLRRGRVHTPHFARDCEFNYRLVGDCLEIYDYPTTMGTSYNTARIILNMDADDGADPSAESRFLHKELETFRQTIKILSEERYIRQYVEEKQRNALKRENEEMLPKLLQRKDAVSVLTAVLERQVKFLE